jgi:hypothetical protein
LAFVNRVLKGFRIIDPPMEERIGDIPLAARGVCMPVIPGYRRTAFDEVHVFLALIGYPFTV